MKESMALFAACLFISIAMVCTGCGSGDHSPSSQSNSGQQTSSVPEDQGSTMQEVGSSQSITDPQTAPMPDHVITENEVVGYWSDDSSADEPQVLQLYTENGELKYRMFRIVLGNGSGFNIANEKTIFEYNNGPAHLQGNQGTLMCLASGGEVYIDFYCFDAEDGYMNRQTDGTEWDRWDDFPYAEMVDEHYN